MQCVVVTKVDDTVVVWHEGWVVCVKGVDGVDLGRVGWKGWRLGTQGWGGVKRTRGGVYDSGDGWGGA